MYVCMYMAIYIAPYKKLTKALYHDEVVVGGRVVLVSRRLEAGFLTSQSRSRSWEPIVLVSVLVSRSFLDFLETVLKRKSCSLEETVSISLAQTVFSSCAIKLSCADLITLTRKSELLNTPEV